MIKLKDVGITQAFILSLDSGRVTVRAVSKKAQERLSWFEAAAESVGLVTAKSSDTKVFTVYSQFAAPIAVLEALRNELEAEGFTVAIPTYEATELRKKATVATENDNDNDNDNDTIYVFCADD